MAKIASKSATSKRNVGPLLIVFSRLNPSWWIGVIKRTSILYWCKRFFLVCFLRPNPRVCRTCIKQSSNFLWFSWTKVEFSNVAIVVCVFHIESDLALLNASSTFSTNLRKLQGNLLDWHPDHTVAFHSWGKLNCICSGWELIIQVWDRKDCTSYGHLRKFCWWNYRHYQKLINIDYYWQNNSIAKTYRLK